MDLDGYHIGPSRKMYIKFVKKDLRIDRGRVLSKTEKHSSCIYSSIKESKREILSPKFLEK